MQSAGFQGTVGKSLAELLCERRAMCFYSTFFSSAERILALGTEQYFFYFMFFIFDSQNSEQFKRVKMN